MPSLETNFTSEELLIFGNQFDVENPITTILNQADNIKVSVFDENNNLVIDPKDSSRIAHYNVNNDGAVLGLDNSNNSLIYNITNFSITKRSKINAQKEKQ